MRRKLLVTKAQSDLMECMAYMTYVGAKDGTFAFLVPGKIYAACSNVQIFNPHNPIITQILDSKKASKSTLLCFTLSHM